MDKLFFMYLYMVCASAIWGIHFSEVKKYWILPFMIGAIAALLSWTQIHGWITVISACVLILAISAPPLQLYIIEKWKKRKIW